MSRERSCGGLLGEVVERPHLRVLVARARQWRRPGRALRPWIDDRLDRRADRVGDRDLDHAVVGRRRAWCGVRVGTLISACDETFGDALLRGRSACAPGSGPPASACPARSRRADEGAARLRRDVAQATRSTRSRLLASRAPRTTPRSSASRPRRPARSMITGAASSLGGRGPGRPSSSRGGCSAAWRCAALEHGVAGARRRRPRRLVGHPVAVIEQPLRQRVAERRGARPALVDRLLERLAHDLCEARARGRAPYLSNRASLASRTISSTSSSFAAANSRRPVSSSASTTPTENTSLRASSWHARSPARATCSRTCP